MPSAKITVWNEAMYYFHVAPSSYRKIFFVLKHYRKEQSLAAYYLKTHGHLVPAGVERLLRSDCVRGVCRNQVNHNWSKLIRPSLSFLA
jgi:hypothetical protein